MRSSSHSGQPISAPVPHAVFQLGSDCAEKALLGHLLCHEGGSSSFWPRLSPGLFFFRGNRLIFEAVQHMRETGLKITSLTVTEFMMRLGKVDDAGGHGVLADLPTRYDDHAPEYHLGQLEELARLRCHFEAARAFQRMLEEGTPLDECLQARATREASAPLNHWHTLGQLMDLRRFDAALPPPPTRVFYRLGPAIIGTAGNIMGVQSQAKAGKTAAITGMLASVILGEGSEEYHVTPGSGVGPHAVRGVHTAHGSHSSHPAAGDCLGFTSSNPHGHAVIHIDTEQSPFDHHQCLRNALLRAGIELPEIGNSGGEEEGIRNSGNQEGEEQSEQVQRTHSGDPALTRALAPALFAETLPEESTSTSKSTSKISGRVPGDHPADSESPNHQRPAPSDPNAGPAAAGSTLNSPVPGWLRSYRLCDIPTAQRRAALSMELDRAARECGGIHSVMLDGIGDFVTDPNDAAEAFAFVEELVQHATRHACLIVCVLHENPGGLVTKMRGHLGSQLERKAETNLRLEKDPEGITTLFTDRSRHAHIPKHAGPRFQWSGIAGMHITAGDESRPKTGPQTQAELQRHRLELIGQEVFEEPIRWTDGVARIEEVARVKHRRAVSIFIELRDGGYITQGADKLWVLSTERE